MHGIAPKTATRSFTFDDQQRFARLSGDANPLHVDPIASRRMLFGTSQLSAVVPPGAFRDQRALVIGGSRGLGELSAKLLAAGGADVRVTYHAGREDAGRVVQDIHSAGGRADCVQYSVSESSAPLPSILGGWMPTHLYYFATPHIAAAHKREFSAELFREFCRFYVDGLLVAVSELHPLGLQGVFYPSAGFVETVPVDMGEYAAAKAAGEKLGEFLDKTKRSLTVHCPRLPRLPTDQTVSLFAVREQESVPLFMAYFCKLRDATANEAGTKQTVAVIL